MAIGERIKFLRKLRNMTQTELGMEAGFSKSTSFSRIAQYEKGIRTPGPEIIEQMAKALDVSAHALTTPEIDTYVGLMHTLFAAQDLYGLEITEIEGELCIHLDKSKGFTYIALFQLFNEWNEQHKKYLSGEITKEEYDNWKYKYPESKHQ